MKFPGLCAGTYADKSLTPAGDRCKNLYPHTLNGAGSPEAQKVLVHTPGYTPDLSFFSGHGIDAIWIEPATGARLICSNNTLYGPGAIGGTIGVGPYQFSSNGVQVMISCIGSETAYIVTLATGAVAQITAAGFMGTWGNVMVDNYFVSLVPRSRKFQISAILDGTQWDAADFTLVEGGPEQVEALHVDHGELWVFSQSHTEIYQNTGNALFPFERIKSIFIPQGVIPSQSRAVCSTDNSVFWIGRSRDGWCRVFRSDGYIPRGISNRSVEYFFNMYSNEIGGGRWQTNMYSYQNETGHTFVVINFPDATTDIGPDGKPVTGSISGAQWVYDVTENEWHERMQIGGDGKEAMPNSYYHASNGNVHYVAARGGLTLYTMDENTFTNGGFPIKRVRRTPHVVNGLKWIVYNFLRLSAKIGFSPTAGAADDKIYLRVSKDGGMTWSNSYAKSLGHTGEYEKEICWRQLGRAKRMAFEFTTSVMAPICLIDADLNVTGEQ